MKENKFIILEIGTLKYNRIKSIVLFKNELSNFNFKYTLSEAKELFDEILNNSYSDMFGSEFKYCVDHVFSDTKYIEYNVYQFEPPEKNFPDDFTICLA